MPILPVMLLTFAPPAFGVDQHVRLSSVGRGYRLEVGGTRAVVGTAIAEVGVDAKVRGGWQNVLQGVDSPIAGGEGRLSVVAGSSGQKTVELRGTKWTLRVDAQPGRPSIRFVLSADLEQPVVLTGDTTLAGMRAPAATVTSEQGPMSIYGGNVYGAGLPAAYAWRSGAEVMAFFDMTPATWFGIATPRRFLDARVVAHTKETQTTLGLRSFATHRTQCGPGRVELVWHVAARENPVRPTRIEALARTIDLAAPLHPDQSPPSRIPRWESYSRSLMATLRGPDAAAEIVRPWDDGPLHLVPPIERVLTHPSHVGQTGSDFSTTNNHLSPSLLYLRLNPNQEEQEAARRKLNQLPIYFNDRDRFIGWNPYGTGSLAMSWQTLWFSIESLRAYDAASAGDFNPSVAGRFLLGTRGLEELATKSAYAFPQWWHAESKLPAIQNDVPELGVVYEPWQAGQYAYIMLRAHEIDADALKFAEAKRALVALFERVRFSVKNSRYERTYSDSADFPITELFGNAYGAVASYKLHASTKDPRYKTYGRYFLATLLRLTPWYEDQVGPVATQLSSLGLFYPHGGAYNPTPWETTEANLCLAWVLANVPDAPYRDLLVRLSNLNRVNSSGFYAASWPTVVQEHAGKEALKHPFLPVEPFYSFEAPGGHTGAPILYSSTSLWNYWLYEALAHATSPEVMVLNLSPLDGYESALASAERRFLLYNSSSATKRFVVKMKRLAPGTYRLERRTSNGWRTLRQADSIALEEGTELEAASKSSLEIRLRNGNPTVLARVKDQLAARNSLAAAYARLHELPTETALPQVANYRRAMDLFRSGHFPSSRRAAEQVK